jgi:glycosyltransferase involved in cell wall biosynthesis
MLPVIDQLLLVVSALAGLLSAILAAALPHWLLILWLLAAATLVDWVPLRRLILAGGWLPALLLMLGTAYANSILAPGNDYVPFFWGLQPSPLIRSFAIVTAWIAVAMAIGAIQLALFPHRSAAQDAGQGI